ncbi:AraC family transcriptional regulator [Paenibacillus macquariensis]|uniref:ABC-type Fe3+-hydroxamate transport system, substrate-binding protein n=1 Tax=Paenibacillus macquariensis TaxID=948756 RepID=A0ABY1K9G2_9BACL|nr:AraC family transcriptional regulator [Paenibacillus macquariensis]MEC0091622.1 AraC family transcriptional regulator [Paenibacillus macquariensis]OAB26741.1 hypothetical protein PMSM_26655 [Paenibacillus macquariensis subsp. macquariensis]SIR45830.1 ABC-type Fe3+-hydroxamate transport system, substrate-binding protein [Paenibacillus macquariensis]
MNKDPIPISTTQSLLFHLDEVRLCQVPSGGETLKERNPLHTLMVVTQGQAGGMTDDYRKFHLVPGRAFLVCPQSGYQLQNETECTLIYYRLSFSAIQMRGMHPQLYNGELASRLGELTAHPLTRILRLVKLMEEAEISSNELGDYKRQLCFQELMVLLLQHNIQPESVNVDGTKLVEDTLTYIHSHYMERISVRQLAELAGVMYQQYTRIFQQLTGKKPLDYLNELRIERSKEWLRNTDAPLREIAHLVGFQDEYYFNRRFRQMTGQAPRQYSKSTLGLVHVRDWLGNSVEIPQRPRRIVYHGETFGDLVALGVDAVEGSALLEERIKIGEKLSNVVDVGFLIDVAKLGELEPDLIILASSDEEQYNKAMGIAPTVTFDSFAPLEERLHTLGNLLGVRVVAEQWLENYKERTEQMWMRLSEELQPGESASVFITDRGGRFFVMGTIGLPATLYHKSGFQAPSSIGQLLDRGVSYMEISIDDLTHFAGDRIFMVLTKEASSRQAAYELAESKVWKGLPAVRSGHAYWVEDCEWNYGDALTSIHILDMLPDLLTRSS